MITTGSVPAALAGGPPRGPDFFASVMPAIKRPKPPKQHKHRSAFPEKPQAHHIPDMPAAYPVGAGG